MSVYQNSNQFAQTALLGAPDLAFNFNTKSVQIDPESVATGLQVGQAMKLVAGAVPTILVDQADSTDIPFGVIWYSPKKNTSLAPGKTVEVACKGSVIYLESAAAITRGAAVENVPTGPTVQTKASGARLGYALDQATGAGQLIRVEVDPAAA